MKRSNLIIIILSLFTAFFLLSCSSAPPEPVAQPVEEKYLIRGRELVEGLAACGYCHGVKSEPGSPLAGGRALANFAGDIYAPNITSAESGIGDWSADSVMAALRAGSSDDENEFLPGVHRGYQWMSDEDALSVVSYIKLSDPVETEVAKTRSDSANRKSLEFWTTEHGRVGYVPEIGKKFTVAYGKYLVDSVARCQSCHNSEEGMFSDEGYLEGGRTRVLSKGTEATVPSLKSSMTEGLGAWSEEDLIKYLKTGINPSGRKVDPADCPVNFFRNGSDNDLIAMSRYLKSLAAK